MANETVDQKLFSIFKGAVIAAGGAAFVYLSGVDWGQLGPVVAAVAAVGFNIIRKFLFPSEERK